MLADSVVALTLTDLFFCAILVVVAFAAALIFRGVRHGSRQS